MQLGHVAVALTISSFAPELSGGAMKAFSVESMLLSLAAHELPNIDGLPIMLGWAKKAFHCTWTHSLLFAFVISLLLLLLRPAWAGIALVGILLHFLCDMPSSVGLPVLYPFYKRRITFNLWADTGYFGWESTKGTYMQAWTWILEGGAFLFLFIRAYQEAVWPFI
jgi:membrane-bound metal-dependent hydrolase YbcI (DUF457 family)